MKNSIPRRIALLLLGSAVALAPLAADAAARTASRGGGGGHSGARSGGARTGTHSATPAPRSSTATRATAPRATAPRGGKQTANGTATYGYGYGYGYGHGGGYYPYYPGWGYPYYGDYGWGYGSWSVGVGFGWPYWGYGGYWGPYYGYPSPYGVEPAAEAVGPAGIEIDVSPRNARVICNGEDLGRVKDYDGRWDHLRVGAGRQVLEIRADGFKTLRVVVDAEAGRAYRLEYALEKGEGIDPRSQDPAALPPPQSARPAQAAIEAPPADGAPGARLEKGFLRLAVMPADAAVYLDGEYFARGDEITRLRGAIPLAVGEHRIEVVRPGYASRTVVVNVDREATASTTVELTPEP